MLLIKSNNLYITFLCDWYNKSVLIYNVYNLNHF